MNPSAGWTAMPSMTATLETAFFDTNLFLYAYSLAPEDREKCRIARGLLENHRPVISLQVVQEFIATALRKPALGIDETKIDEFLSLCAYYTIQPAELRTALHATALRRRFSISHWDSLILAAACASGCSVLFSEDMQHGFTMENLRVVNPFTA
jgi:predicted nucleic acid-binding protein